MDVRSSLYQEHRTRLRVYRRLTRDSEYSFSVPGFRVLPGVLFKYGIFGKSITVVPFQVRAGYCSSIVLC